MAEVGAGKGAAASEARQSCPVPRSEHHSGSPGVEGLRSVCAVVLAGDRPSGLRGRTAPEWRPAPAGGAPGASCLGTRR